MTTLCHVAYNERKEGRGEGRETERERKWWEREEREREGEQGGKRVRQCEVTPLPLAVRRLPRTGAAARSDCTPLKQRALVI